MLTLPRSGEFVPGPYEWPHFCLHFRKRGLVLKLQETCYRPLRLLRGQDGTSGPLEPLSFLSSCPLNCPPVAVLCWDRLMPCHSIEQEIGWGGGRWVETVNPQSGKPSLCPGRPLIPKPNSRQCWARCRPNPLPASLGLAKGPLGSHALSPEGCGQMLPLLLQALQSRRTP